jgi:hypothetical protein
MPENLRDKINVELKEHLVSDDTTDLYEFVNICIFFETRIKAITSNKRRLEAGRNDASKAIARRPARAGDASGQASFNANTNSAPRTPATTGAASNRAPAPRTSQLYNPKPIEERVFNFKECYNCREVGHIARDCPHPKKPSVNRIEGEEQVDGEVVSDDGQGKD